MTIRRMEARDYAAYCALMDELHGLHRAARPDIYAPAPALPDEAAFAERLKDEIGLVCEDAGGVIGLAVMRVRTYAAPAVKTHTTGWIEDICVKREARGRGAGRLLYEALMREAKRAGLERVELNVWAFNEEARAFYEHMGMSERSRVMEARVK